MASRMNPNSDLIEKVRKAARVGIDTTTAAAVVDAKSNHSFQNQTGTLEGSVQMRPAEEVGSEVRGQWGSYDVDYAGPIEEKMPFLRPAADANYADLAGNIRKALGN